MAERKIINLPFRTAFRTWDEAYAFAYGAASTTHRFRVWKAWGTGSWLVAPRRRLR